MPAIWYVTNGNDSGSGSLRAAYEAAESAGNGQEIIIDEDVETITLNSPLDTGAMNFTTIEITGEDPADPPQISPNAFDFFDFRFLDHSGNNGVTIILENLHLKNFGTTGDGGAIKTVAPLYLVNCDFEDNRVDGSGGAVFAEYLIDMSDCTFTGNDAGADGGAIFCEPTNTGAGITITDCGFTSNTATDDGGAIAFITTAGTFGIYGDLTVFTGNTAGGNGGAVFQFGGAIEAISSGSANTSTSGFQGNSGADGFALHLEELNLAHIDIVVSNLLNDTIWLNSTLPPTMNSYWADINTSRVSGGSGSIDSNWPF